MKKILAVALALAMLLIIVSCGKEQKPVDDPSKKSEGVMTYDEYAKAELNTKVVVETYVQDKQSWWDNKATIYTQDADGAYFIYNMACTEEEYGKLTKGTKIKVEGYKSAWAGEVEITDATFTILDGNYVAPATDVTSHLGKDTLINYQNRFASFKGLTVEAYDETGAAFAYKNAVDKTDDLYFKVSLDGKIYNFCVEFYLCGKDTDVYKAVEALKVGDKIDVEGFVYWYNGVNPHVTSVKVVGKGNALSAKSEGTMTYAEYAAAELDTKVVVETYIQNKQSWWENKATFYTQDLDGAYFLYNMACSEADYANLVPGTKIKVTGYKSAWSGEVEITDATFEIMEGSYIAPAKDVTSLLGKDELINNQNRFVSFKGLTVEAYDETGAAFAYKNAVDKTDDLYFKVSLDGQTYGFCVEFYLCGKDTDVYKAVEALKVGDKIDVEGFLYWYNGVNPHVTSVKVVG